MQDIELNELPKSKKFMKHAKIADGLTKETGLEHGFIFCKPNDEIIVDKMCVGNECNIDILSNQCKNNENSFHTHPNREQSNLSANDIIASLYEVENSNFPNISCVSGTDAEYIRCDKIKTEGINPKTVHFKYLNRTGIEINTDLFLFHAKSNFIEFNKKTKEIEFEGNHRNISKSSQARFKKEHFVEETILDSGCPQLSQVSFLLSIG